MWTLCSCYFLYKFEKNISIYILSIPLKSFLPFPIKSEIKSIRLLCIIYYFPQNPKKKQLKM